MEKRSNDDYESDKSDNVRQVLNLEISNDEDDDSDSVSQILNMERRNDNKENDESDKDNNEDDDCDSVNGLAYKDAKERAERVLGRVSILRREREEKEQLDKVSPLPKNTGTGNRNFRFNTPWAANKDDQSVTTQSDLTYEELQEKYRQTKMTMMKLDENFTLKYLRLQQEHNQLEDSFLTLECQVQEAKLTEQQMLRKRDEAYQEIAKVSNYSHHDQEIIKRISDENENLRKQLDELKSSCHEVLLERDYFNRKLEQCSCKMKEMNELSEGDDNKRPSLNKRSSIRTEKGYGVPSYALRGKQNSRASSISSVRSSLLSSFTGTLSRKDSDLTTDSEHNGYFY